MVEWKKLGEVISVHTGSQLNRNDMLELGDYPVINGGRTPSGYTNEPNEKGNSITISQGGESAGYVNWMDCDFWAGAHCYVVDCLDDTIKRYVYHFLKNTEHELMASKQGAGIPGLNRKNLYKLDILVPSIAEQNLIVGILDTFTASIDNLKQQIAQRRKQYEHYRDQLLDLEGKPGVEMKTIGEVCKTISPPKKLGKELYQDTGLYPIIDQGQKAIVGYTDDKSALVSSDKYVLFGDHTRYVKYHDGQFAQGADGLKILKVKNNILPRYFFFAFANTEIPSRGYSRHWSIAKDLNIPLPSLEEQSRIVSILDEFEASIKNLEAQLMEREKQYEYYRNKLLTFE